LNNKGYGLMGGRKLTGGNMKKIFYIFIILLLALTVDADITFTNGFWSTTFNCSTDQVFDHTSPPTDMELTCTDTPSGVWLMYSHLTKCSDQNSQIVESSNYSGGGGTRGLYVPGDRGNYVTGGDTFDGYLNFRFDTAQPEIWIRWYQRGDGGGNRFNHGKDIYFFNGVSNPYWRISVHDDATSWGQVSSHSCDDGNCTTGMITLEGSLYSTTWHCYEVHYKDNGSGSVTAHFWHDGILVETYTVTLSGSGDISEFLFKQASGFNGTGCGYYYIDDVAIATPSYTGFVKDGSNNDMIGLLNGVITPKTATMGGSETLTTGGSETLTIQ